MYIVYLTVFITAFACQVSTMRNVLVRVRNNFSESRPGRTCIKSLSTGISHGCLRTHFAHVDVKRSAQRKAAGVRSAFRHVCKHCSVEGTQHSQQHRLQRPGPPQDLGSNQLNRYGLGGAALLFILGSNLGGVGPGRGLRGGRRGWCEE